jgi:phosphoglycerate dehydrogenase-like enzyme
VGIIGYGSIGRNIAKVLSGFNVKIITLNSKKKITQAEKSQVDLGYLISGTGDPLGEFPLKWYSSGDFEEKKKFFEQSDVVVVVAPYKPSTKHLVDAEAIRQMKKTAFIVNVARGELIDQDALIKALKNKAIGGAALDVVTPEPYPSDGALLTEFTSKEDREMLVLTPHVSGYTDKYVRRVVEIFCENVNRLENGKPLVNFVDRS